MSFEAEVDKVYKGMSRFLRVPPLSRSDEADSDGPRPRFDRDPTSMNLHYLPAHYRTLTIAFQQ